MQAAWRALHTVHISASGSVLRRIDIASLCRDMPIEQEGYIMYRYVIKRLLLMIPILLCVVFIVFTIMSLTPGDPGRMILGMNASQEAVDALNASLGYDKPFLIRFFDYLNDILHGNFGRSYRNNQPVFDEIFARFPTTLKLSLASIVVTIVVGIPLGVLAAVKQYSFIDGVSTVFALFIAAVPSFWLALLCILLFSLTLGWLPPNGIGSISHYIMPTITLAAAYSASIMRLTRSTMLEAMQQDYIRTARGKGATEKRVIWRHAIKNALLPVITSTGMAFGGLLGGTIVIEQVFGIPGLGTLVVMAIRQKDFPQVMAITIFLSAMFCVIMLVVDLLYAFIDPRIKALYTAKR